MNLHSHSNFRGLGVRRRGGFSPGVASETAEGEEAMKRSYSLIIRRNSGPAAATGNGGDDDGQKGSSGKAARYVHEGGREG